MSEEAGNDFEYVSRRRQVQKEQILTQWYWIASLTIILMIVVALLGKVVGTDFVNPLKAKQLAYLIAKPPAVESGEADSKGHVSDTSADSRFPGLNLLFGVAHAEDAPPEEAAESADAMSSQTILGDVLELIMMTILYILFAMALSGIYIVWTVRQVNFYMHEDHLEYVESRLVEAFGLADKKERLAKWVEAKNNDEELGIILELDNHFSEVIKQIGGGVMASETSLDRYFISQTKDIREEEVQKMHLVSTALNVAPAVGFAGTVQGMIVAFSLLGGDVSPEMINMMSQGIFVALVTTFMALLVKSTGLMIKAQIANRINFFTMQLQLVSSEVSANLRTRKAKGEAAA